MFLILNALVASFDGLIIGINLKLSKVKFTKFNAIIFSIINVLVYTIFLLFYNYLPLKFFNKNMATFLYLFLAYSSFKNQNNTLYQHELSLKDNIIIALAHCLDGAFISLNFIYVYSLLYIVIVFSLMAVSLVIIGYKFANCFKNFKASNIIASLLFILLALINYFL